MQLAGRPAGTAQSAFALRASGEGSNQVASNVSTDKQTYAPSETVRISDRVSNLAVNAMQNDLHVITKLTAPDSAIVFVANESLPQLSSPGLKPYTYGVPLHFAPAGVYAVTLSVTGANGNVLSQSRSTLTVTSSAATGSGLVGTLSAVPKQVPVGDAAVLTFTTNNQGNSDLPNLPLTVSIIEPLTQKILASFPYVKTLPRAAPFSAAISWTTAGTVGTSYVGVLSATISGQARVLAQDTFTLITPPVKLDVRQVIPVSSRVLVLLRCRSSARGGDDDEHGSDESRQCGDDSDDSDDSDEERDSSANQPVDACLAPRAQAIASLLTAAGVRFQITHTVHDFKRAMRTGAFNVYWISGAQYALGNRLAKELREAVYQGDSLISDGGAQERNGVLDDVGAVHFQGRLGRQLHVTLKGNLYPSALTLGSQGVAQRLTPLSGAVVEGTFVLTSHESVDDDARHHEKSDAHSDERGNAPKSDAPAVISHPYGAGKALTFGLDLATTLIGPSATWNAPLKTAFSALTPAAPAAYSPGGFLPIKIEVLNQANAVQLGVQSAIPAASRYIDSVPTGTFDSSTSTLAWSFGLAAQKQNDLFFNLRLPPVAGELRLVSTLRSITGANSKVYGDPLTLNVTVKSGRQRLNNAVTALQSLIVTRPKDMQLRQKIVGELREIAGGIESSHADTLERTIGELLQVTDRLATWQDVDTSAARAELDALLKETQWRWTELPFAPPTSKESVRRQPDR